MYVLWAFTLFLGVGGVISGIAWLFDLDQTYSARRRDYLAAAVVTIASIVLVGLSGQMLGTT